MGLDRSSAALISSEVAPLPSAVFFSISLGDTVFCSFSERLLLRALLSDLP
jgi:hypothetical protein